MRHLSILGILLPIVAQPVMGQSVIRRFPAPPSVDWFGRSVDGGADLDGIPGDDLVVGSPFSSTNGSYRGQVSAYSGASGNLLWERFGTANDQRMGLVVRLLPDVDGDAVRDVAISSLRTPVTAQQFGSVLVVSGDDGATLREWVGTSVDLYGSALAPAGDIDGDGVCDLVVGCPEESDAGQYSGCVRVLSIATGAQLRQFDGFTNDHLGVAVAGNLDANGDGVPDIVCTSQRASTPSDYAGYVRVYSGANSSVLKHIFGPFNGTSSGFGWAVDVIGDVDLDGRLDYAVGAPGDPTFGNESGMIRGFSGRTGAVLWTAFGAYSGERMGHAVRGLGDIDLDGVPDVIAMGQANSPTKTPARLFSGADGTLVFCQAGYATDHAAVAPGGDIDADGRSDYLVGESDFVAVSGRGRVDACSGTCLPARPYCVAKVNSRGCLPAISGAGLPTLGGADDFHVQATLLINNKASVLIWSSGQAAVPFYGGTLCLATPIKRVATGSTGGSPPPDNCTGALDFHWSHAFMTSKGLQPGDNVNAQFWHRDNGFAFPNNVGLSDGLEFTIGI